jgi:hypothetical protein
VAIDDSGEWWTGTGPDDLPVFLAELTLATYPATEFRPVRCGCGSDRFRLVRAREVTQRTCAGCGRVGYISRGKVVLAAWREAVEEEGPEPFRCVGCGGDEANVCVGFAGYPDAPQMPPAVRWFYVGTRCCACGILGEFNNGKVGRYPPEEVYPEVLGEIADRARKPGRKKKRG